MSVPISAMICSASVRPIPGTLSSNSTASSHGTRTQSRFYRWCLSSDGTKLGSEGGRRGAWPFTRHKGRNLLIELCQLSFQKVDVAQVLCEHEAVMRSHMPFQRSLQLSLLAAQFAQRKLGQHSLVTLTSDNGLPALLAPRGP